MNIIKDREFVCHLINNDEYCFKLMCILENEIHDEYDEDLENLKTDLEYRLNLHQMH